MQAKYTPPFDWRMICQYKQTTPDQERERWRRIQAWKRITGTEVTPEILKAFIAENEDHFAGSYRNVSHILIATRDRVTDMPATAEQEAAAKAKAEDIRQKLDEGLDFGWLAEHYSDDATTAKAKGVLNTPIKKLGGGLDPAFAAAAWKLQAGEISQPIKSKFGYHIIKCDKVTPGTRGAKDFEEPSYREWIVDEYETIQMRAWLADLRAKAKIEVKPNTDLFKLKELKFSDDAPATGSSPRVRSGTPAARVTLARDAGGAVSGRAEEKLVPRRSGMSCSAERRLWPASTSPGCSATRSAGLRPASTSSGM